MKVRELIAKLRMHDEDREVRLDYGGTVMEIDELFDDEEDGLVIG